MRGQAAADAEVVAGCVAVEPLPRLLIADESVCQTKILCWIVGESALLHDASNDKLNLRFTAIASG